MGSEHARAAGGGRRRGKIDKVAGTRVWVVGRKRSGAASSPPCTRLGAWCCRDGCGALAAGKSRTGACREDETGWEARDRAGARMHLEMQRPRRRQHAAAVGGGVGSAHCWGAARRQIALCGRRGGGRQAARAAAHILQKNPNSLVRLAGNEAHAVCVLCCGGACVRPCLCLGPSTC